MDRYEKRPVVVFVLTIAMFLIFASAASAELVYINDTSVNPGDSTTVPILIYVTDPSGLGAATIELHYNSSVVNVTSASDSDFDAITPNIQNSLGYTRMVTYQSSSLSGVGPGTIQFANITLQSVGAAGDSSLLSLSVITLSSNTGIDTTNNPPVLDAIGPKSVYENNLLTFLVNASDPDDDLLTYSTVGLPNGATLNESTGVFSWTPTHVQIGLHPVEFKVTDGIDNDTETVVITVTPLPSSIIKIDNGYAPTDQTTTINITALNVTDLANFDITVTYNASVVNVTSANNNPAFGVELNNLEQASNGMVRLATFNFGAGQSGDVLVSTLTLKSLGVSGQISDLNLTVNEFINSPGNNIPVSIQNATFTVGLPQNGDINGDGVMSTGDGIYLAKHVLGFSGYEIIYADGDINGDGVMSTGDGIYLAKHVLGFSGYEVIY
jgi:hypothetical protein